MFDSPVRTTVLATVATLVFGLPTGLRAENSFESNIEGTYEATVSEANARQKINVEIEKVVTKMIFFKRPFARSEIQEATEPCSTLRIAIDDDQITIRCDDRKPTTSKKDATTTTWTSYDDEIYTLSQEVESDRIVQTFESDQGTRTNVYRLKDDDTLLLEAELDSDQIPEPVTFDRTFERADE